MWNLTSFPTDYLFGLAHISKESSSGGDTSSKNTLKIFWRKAERCFKTPTLSFVYRLCSYKTCCLLFKEYEGELAGHIFFWNVDEELCQATILHVMIKDVSSFEFFGAKLWGPSLVRRHNNSSSSWKKLYATVGKHFSLAVTIVGLVWLLSFPEKNTFLLRKHSRLQLRILWLCLYPFGFTHSPIWNLQRIPN